MVQDPLKTTGPRWGHGRGPTPALAPQEDTVSTTTDRTQIHLPGQAHAAPGPLDMSGMYLMHHALRRDLTDFVGAVRRTPVGEQEVWDALERRWARFDHVLHHHHTAEDEHVWPQARANAVAAGRTDAVAVLDSMEAEHELIDPALRACTEAFAAMRSHPCPDHRNALDIEVTEAAELLGRHLAREEREAIVLLQELLSPEQWAASEEATAKSYGLGILPFAVPWAFKGLAGVDRAAVDPFLGGIHRVLLRLLTPRFLRREREAFRYV